MAPPEYDHESLLSDDLDMLHLRNDPLEEARNFFISSSMKSRIKDGGGLEGFDLPTMARVKQICEQNDNLAEQKKELLKYWKEEYFEKWYHSMGCGFNIMVYGLGSKRTLLEKFRQQWLIDEHHLVLYGFFTHLSLRQVVGEISRAFGSATTLSDATQLVTLINESDHDLYIMFHSMDVVLSQGTSGSKIKEFLTILLTECSGKIHLIASSDHVNSGILWSSNDCHTFRWLNFACHLLESYTIEKSYSAGYDSKASFSLANHLNQNLTLSSIEHVYESLTTNAQKIFQLILRFYSNLNKAAKAEVKTKRGRKPSKPAQVSSDDGSDEEGGDRRKGATGANSDPSGHQRFLAFSELYRDCREEFLVNSEATLRAQLVEFKDHKLIKLAKTNDGTETVCLLISDSVIEKFLSKIEEQN